MISNSPDHPYKINEFFNAIKCVNFLFSTSFQAFTMDSGLMVVICIASSMIISVISLLFFVKYEWCHVLFRNNTVISDNFV